MTGAPPPRRRALRALLLVAQLALVAALLWFAGRPLLRDWETVESRLALLSPRWGTVALSGVVVLLGYLLLVETWRRVMRAWGSRLAFGVTARIWFVSALGRYVPGKVWQIGAMGVLSQRAGVSPVVATGSSVVVNLVNILAAFVVVLATGARAIEVPGSGWAAMAVLAVALLGTPWLLPRVAQLAERLTGRRIEVRRVPARSLVIAAAGCIGAWLLYGAAFWLLARAVLPAPPDAGDLGGYIAVYTASYIFGYLVLFAPGGIVAREGMMTLAFTRLGLAGSADALLLAVASRLWLTVLEIVPSLLFLLARPPRIADRSPSPSDDVATPRP